MEKGRGASEGWAGMKNGLFVVACLLGLPGDDHQISFVWFRCQGLESCGAPRPAMTTDTVFCPEYRCTK